MTPLDYQAFINNEESGVFLKKSLISSYQKLSTEAQKCYLVNVLKKDFKDWFDYQINNHTPTLFFLIKEYLNHGLFSQLTESKNYDNFVHAILYCETLNTKKELKIKKEIIELLIEHTNFDVNGKHNNIPFLHLAAVQNEISFIKWLVEKGAKTNELDNDNDTLASSTLWSKPNIKVLEYVINLPDFNPLIGNNILCIALSKDYNDAIQLIATSHLIHHEDFLKEAWQNYPEKMEKLVKPFYEKYKLDTTLINSNKIPTKRLKL